MIKNILTHLSWEFSKQCQTQVWINIFWAVLNYQHFGGQSGPILRIYGNHHPLGGNFKAEWLCRNVTQWSTRPAAIWPLGDPGSCINWSCYRHSLLLYLIYQWCQVTQIFRYTARKKWWLAEYAFQNGNRRFSCLVRSSSLHCGASSHGTSHLDVHLNK